MIEKYNIISKPPKTTTGITLGRIAALCGWAPSIVMRSGRVNPVVNQNLGFPGYPLAMRTPVFGSMIPLSLPTDTHNTLFKGYLFHQYLFDSVINQKKKKDEKHTAPEQIRNYVVIAQKSKMSDDAFRIKMLKEWNILSEVEGRAVIHQDRMAALSVAEEKYKILEKVSSDV